MVRAELHFRVPAGPTQARRFNGRLRALGENSCQFWRAWRHKMRFIGLMRHEMARWAPQRVRVFQKNAAEDQSGNHSYWYAIQYLPY